MFSIEQTTIQLSYLSLTTSHSISFQPPQYSSIRICFVKENAFLVISKSCFLSYATPEPRPPKAYAIRHITGKPISSAAFIASSTFFTALLSGTFKPISFIFLTKRSRSSVSRIEWIGVPRTFTL